MGKTEYYRKTLRTSADWERFLLQESGLPGPRANLELVNVVAEEGTEAQFKHFLTFDERKAPRNSQEEFLAVCGVVGMGQLLIQGNPEALKILRAAASDSRWRVREGVAIALQRFGDTDMERLLSEMELWSRGNFLEMRTAAASLCEPRLLKQTEHAIKVLIILDHITKSISKAKNRNTDAFKALRKSMGYCWSVAAAANLDAGMSMMEQWFASKDKDIRWIMRENLKKKRLQRIDAAWVQDCRLRLEQKEVDLESYALF
ncbi:MAG: HEAT repeat domain-containing protein [Halobacteriota archaeon]